MLDSNAMLVLQKRYLVRDDKDNPLETPEDMFQRVAKTVASAEDGYKGGEPERMAEEFHQAMVKLEFLPNSPTLMNAGRELGQLSACFVLPVEDSLDSIFESVKETAKIHQTGGGTGFSFSRLRPKDDIVGSTKGHASGPISFIRVFNAATEVIKQGGTRRGANMGILRVDHPDIEEFVTIKRNPSELTNFNLSVAITDSFIEAYKKDEHFPLVNPRTGIISRRVKARELLGLIASSAWASGEPGIIFIDNVNRANTVPGAGTIEATNPCGEQPLLPYESCCLASINLSKMVRGNAIDWQKIGNITHLGVRFLDNVIDVNRYPFPDIEKATKANRKIGLGVMGFAHMMIKLGIPYDSPASAEVAEEVMNFIQRESKVASGELAQSRRVFPNFKWSVWKKKGLSQRNATTTTIAPTGTLSIIANTSSGIEPIYDVTYTRQLLGGITVNIEDPLYEVLSKKMGSEYIKRVFRTAYQVLPGWHLEIQRAFQDHVDNAVSKTINLPEETTVGEILSIYLEAHRAGLKGTTVFRNKSREHQVLSCESQQLC